MKLISGAATRVAWRNIASAANASAAGATAVMCQFLLRQLQAHDDLVLRRAAVAGGRKTKFQVISGHSIAERVAIGSAPGRSEVEPAP